MERKESEGPGRLLGRGARSEEHVLNPHDGMDLRRSIAAGMSCAQGGAGNPKAKAVGVVEPRRGMGGCLC